MILARPFSSAARTLKRTRSPATTVSMPSVSMVQHGACAQDGSMSKLNGEPRMGTVLHVIDIE